MDKVKERKKKKKKAKINTTSVTFYLRGCCHCWLPLLRCASDSMLGMVFDVQWSGGCTGYSLDGRVASSVLPALPWTFCELAEGAATSVSLVNKLAESLADLVPPSACSATSMDCEEWRFRGISRDSVV